MATRIRRRRTREERLPEPTAEDRAEWRVESAWRRRVFGEDDPALGVALNIERRLALAAHGNHRRAGAEWDRRCAKCAAIAAELRA